MRRISILILAMVAASCLGASVAMAQINQPAIMLHVDEFLKNACNNFTISGCNDILTSTDRVDPSGGTASESYVYVLAVGSEGEDVTGMEFEIWYNFVDGQASGLKIFQWARCADQDFASPNWPNPGENNVIAWTDCRSSDREIPRVAGFLFVSAYSPSLMQTLPRLEGRYNVTNCSGSEVAVAFPERSGWVTFGGASGGGDTDGCNSCLEDCSAVPVEPKTWGGIKSQFGGPDS